MRGKYISTCNRIFSRINNAVIMSGLSDIVPAGVTPREIPVDEDLDCLKNTVIVDIRLPGKRS